MINNPQTLADILANDREHLNARVEAMNEGRPFTEFAQHSTRVRLREEYYRTEEQQSAVTTFRYTVDKEGMKQNAIEAPSMFPNHCTECGDLKSHCECHVTPHIEAAASECDYPELEYMTEEERELALYGNP